MLLFRVRKSSKTWLLHLGHLGLLSKDMMMYMMQLGQPTTTIDLATPSPPSDSSEHNDEDVRIRRIYDEDLPFTA